MTYEDAQRAYDNETPEDYELPERCPECGFAKCKCGDGWTFVEAKKLIETEKYLKAVKYEIDWYAVAARVICTVLPVVFWGGLAMIVLWVVK